MARDWLDEVLDLDLGEKETEALIRKMDKALKPLLAKGIGRANVKNKDLGLRKRNLRFCYALKALSEEYAQKFGVVL